MLKCIKNEKLSITVHSTGAELWSIKTVKDGLEYLWQGDAKFWDGRSPLLFPFVGKLRNNQYFFQGHPYTMQIHGFAREHNFKLVEEAENRLGYEMENTKETNKIYPFDFLLRVTYELVDNQICISFQVINRGAEKMWFSIGAHPGFNCPFFSDECMEDYSLVFDQCESIKRRILKDGLLSGEYEPFLEGSNVWRLSREAFAKKAIVLDRLQSKSVTLQSRRHNRKVKVSFDGFPYLGIWSSGNSAPFICIEPWHGIASSVEGSDFLEKKEGIRTLEPAEKFSCSYSISILDD